MSAKRRKDSTDDRLGSGDLFGDLVDAPLPPSRPEATSRDPIRVRLREKGSASPPGANADALPDEVSELLDALVTPPPAGGTRRTDEGKDDLKLVEPGREEPLALQKTGPKFQVTPSPHAAAAGRRLDLAAVAEDAFGSPPPAPPGAAQASWRNDEYGPYRLLDRVAVGGMAEVFKAKRSGVAGFEKIVAVKRILPHLSENREFVDMFVNEAKMVAGLAHPNIVQIHDLGKIEKSYYIAMEYVHGRDLRTILKRAREKGLRVPLDLSIRIVSQVCAALDYAARKKDDRGRPMSIVHRDVSPQNILISFDGNVKLTDFGIAKAATKASTTDRGALRGKLLYMSPEQAWGKPIDKRSDLFSLGLVLYEMMTDVKPFMAGQGSGTEMSILETVRQCRIAPPRSVNPRIPESLERIVMKGLEPDPDSRYQDAGEMGRALEGFLREKQPLTANELDRFMELLFENEEREESGAPEPTPSDRPARFSPEPELPPAAPAAPENVAGGEISVESLLERFGIK